MCELIGGCALAGNRDIPAWLYATGPPFPVGGGGRGGLGGREWKSMRSAGEKGE